MKRENLTMQALAHIDRPREKFIEKGGDSLSNAELIAILIGSGNREANAIELSQKILKSANNNLLNLKRYTIEDFKAFKGIGKTKALTIMASFELSKRCLLEQQPINSHIYSSKDAAATIQPILQDLPHEECWILYLNKANALIAKERISRGGVSATVVDIKIILKTAINKLASGIILVHNHPSGNKKPGEQDKIQTKKLKDAATTCDISLLDHIIIAGSSYYSFADEGIL